MDSMAENGVIYILCNGDSPLIHHRKNWTLEELEELYWLMEGERVCHLR